LTSPGGEAISGKADLAVFKVRIWERVGAAAMRLLVNIFSDGISSQSRSVASTDVWSYGMPEGESDRKTVPASIQGDTAIIGTRIPKRSNLNPSSTGLLLPSGVSAPQGGMT
jgi:hypothetical protein